ncbi:hypothetical protein EJB05_10794, partial [Eragrostis curvula]
MEMPSARRTRAKPIGDHVVLWGACLLLSSLSLLVAAVSSGFGLGAAARLTGEVRLSALVRATTTATTGAGVVRGYCGGGGDDDDLGSMSVDGEWVRDDDGERYPLYQPGQCPFVDPGFRCRENGRPDGEYAKWRWRPRRCTLPRFNATKLLETLRNRRLVFVGDSIGRNQWESMLCMLYSAAVAAGSGDEGAVYEENGNPITKHEGFLSFRFRDHNCTVEHYRSPYLVRRGHPPRRAPKRVASTVQVSAMDPRAPRWKDADVLVFNTGTGGTRKGCSDSKSRPELNARSTLLDGKKLRMNMSVEDAYQRAMNTLQKWIQKEVNASKTLIVLRTYSPAHIRATNSGGCATETSPELNTSKISLHQWPGMLNPALEASSRIQVLNVTLMTAQRRDGHPSVYNVGPSLRMPVGQRADCSHWCLPGVPDAWNELLYAMIVRRFS